MPVPLRFFPPRTVTCCERCVYGCGEHSPDCPTAAANVERVSTVVHQPPLTKAQRDEMRRNHVCPQMCYVCLLLDTCDLLEQEHERYKREREALAETLKALVDGDPKTISRQERDEMRVSSSLLAQRLLDHAEAMDLQITSAISTTPKSPNTP